MCRYLGTAALVLAQTRTRPYPESDTSLRPREIPNRRALEVFFSTQALAGCVAGDKELDAAAASLAVVTADGQSRLIEDSDVQKYLDLVEVEKTAAQTEGMELEGASS